MDQDTETTREPLSIFKSISKCISGAASNMSSKMKRQFYEIALLLFVPNLIKPSLL